MSFPPTPPPPAIYSALHGAWPTCFASPHAPHQPASQPDAPLSPESATRILGACQPCKGPASTVCPQTPCPCHPDRASLSFLLWPQTSCWMWGPTLELCPKGGASRRGLQAKGTPYPQHADPQEVGSRDVLSRPNFPT